MTNSTPPNKSAKPEAREPLIIKVEKLNPESFDLDWLPRLVAIYRNSDTATTFIEHSAYLALKEENESLRSELDKSFSPKQVGEIAGGTTGYMLARRDDELTALKKELAEARALVGELTGGCSNTGYYGPLNLSPGECTCANCRARAFLNRRKG